MTKFQDYENVAKEHNIGGGDWMKFKEGENRVRFVSELEENSTHYLKESKRNINCEGEFCEYCQKGDKKRVRFIGWVIDRATGSFSLASIGWSVFKQIGEYSRSSEFGFTSSIPPYDVIIKKTGEGLETEYTVMPSRNETPLNSKELAEIEKLTPPSEIVQKIKDKHPGSRVERVPSLGPKGSEYDDIPVIDEPDKQVSEDDLPF